jgi:protein subunit release factor B
MTTSDPPEPYATDRESLERDSEISFFVAGGPGGQHRNKVATGVRLTHRPSGIVITATERRSQSANREMAYARLAARLEAANYVPKQRRATRPGRAARAKRLQAKQRRAQIKQGRRPVDEG